jgi:hypothetical protein
MCAFVAAVLAIGVAAVPSAPAAPDPLTKDAAVDALHRAVTFFRTHASAGGGYVYRLSDDLQRREGEGMVGSTSAWIQPPGTPAVGVAYLKAWQLTGDPVLRDAALETAQALISTQLESGGWDDRIEFAPADRAKYAYRVDKHDGLNGLRNTTTFDDNKAQSALSFLIQLDAALKYENATLHEAAMYAVDSFLKAQYPNGAWPQRYNEFSDAAEFPVIPASYPDDWPREYPGRRYTSFYTLNDGTLSDLIAVMFEAYDIYNDRRCFDAAVRGGEFLILAQMPDPQPGWAQQYDANMHPVWARKFEPPAITGGESQRAMQTLLSVYRRTGDRKYIEPIRKALAYFRSSLLPDGRLARFYELRTNRPLYFTRQYELTYEANDLPTHYRFIVNSQLDAIEANSTSALTEPAPQTLDRSIAIPRLTDAIHRDAAEAVATLDDRGAWVSDGQLRYWPDDPARRVIDSEVFISNLGRLARFIAAKE